MNREEILREIDDAMAELRDVKAKVNEALCHARNIVANEPQIPHSEAYNKGLEDAWELVKKIADTLTTSERAEIFGYVVNGITVMDILRDFTPQEALAKLEAYEKAKEEIKVGDVVSNIDNGKLLLVTKVYNETFEGIGNHGTVYEELHFEYWKKTGKHIDITSILEQIKEN